jgi:serine/threonine-protein phosphatase CPPED1
MANSKIKFSKERLVKNYDVFLVIILVMVMCGCASKHITNNSKPFFFLQMADPQFGFFTGNKGFTKETINFEKAIKAANRLHPSFVIVCGDLVNQRKNQAQVAEYKQIAGEIDPSIPFYNVPGNHDVGNKPTAGSLADYRKLFGADYYSFKSGNLFGIVLNSSLFFDASLDPEAAVKQDTWLRSTLKEASKLKNTNIVIFQHIPWFINEPDEKDQYFNLPLEQRKIYLDLFHKYGVKYIFAGHLHKNAIGQDGNLEMITTGPVGKPLGRDSSGFRVVKVEGNKILQQYYSLDSIPNQVQLSR